MSNLSEAFSKPLVEINSAGQSKIVWTSVATLILAIITFIAPISPEIAETIRTTLVFGGPILVTYFRMFKTGNAIKAIFSNSKETKLHFENGLTKLLQTPSL
jgi:hypothetical protein